MGHVRSEVVGRSKEKLPEKRGESATRQEEHEEAPSAPPPPTDRVEGGELRGVDEEGRPTRGNDPRGSHERS
jgi:hypothetical protein